ncbi:MAG: hypothetical protein KBT03_03455 [Bacteroidales bacterium]|nr:hypothetical protein [Candidatus Scybalousia scybalohippi]
MKNLVNNINNQVAEMTVAQMRKVAGQYGIKNASKFRRTELSKMVADAMVAEAKAKAEAEKKAAKKAQSSDKRYKADKVAASEVAQMAGQLIADGINGVDLYDVNRKVLIEVMKQLHCKKWYRTYDKPTMVSKIVEAMAA